ncbi:hypothetical protein FA13DRAFT_1785759 [Coprinellus micaceus]|uniref:DUF6534 domain-containing protein n=1 Tax=Coprinellus micaceus TaxID=71717 RepID=A0A4Y7TW85_COPMI|nr:hypothetical protein FA13DRAFT_1785759 [Coprinellus micaceus]
MLPPVSSAGSVLIASMLAYLLFGAYCVQLATCSQTLDRGALRLLVHATTACLVLHLVFATHQAWKLLVVSPGNAEILDWPPKYTVLAIPALNGLLALLVQGYFAWRVWMVFRNGRLWIRVLIPCLIITTSVIQFGATIASTILVRRSLGKISLPVSLTNPALPSPKFRSMDGRFSDLFKLEAPIAIHLTSAVLSDALITGSMVYILNQYKTRTTFAETRSLLNTLIMNVIENCLITTVCAAANLISFFAGAPVLVAYAFQYVMGGL